VSGAAARVAATGTTYVIAIENTPSPASQSATLRRRSARRLKRSDAIEPAANVDDVIPLLPFTPGGPL
jgi:hypothetical protein